MLFIWTFFEIVGTIAFAISGALVGISRRMDIFGMLVLALSTAIGGGIIRDVLVGNIPPNSLKTSLYIILTGAITLVIFVIYRDRKWRYETKRRFIRRSYLIADAFGLASFTVTGTAIGFSHYPHYPVFAVILGVITAIGGGMLRDVLAQRVPSVLREELYATASIVGGFFYYVLVENGYWYLASQVAFFIVFVLRMIGLKYHLNLPKVR